MYYVVEVAARPYVRPFGLPRVPTIHAWDSRGPLDWLASPKQQTYPTSSEGRLSP